MLLMQILFSFISPIIFAMSDEEDASTEYPLVDRVRDAGYPLEIHTVTTDDGYILTIHRIKHGKENEDNANKEVVFLMHGLQSSAYCYVICEESLAFFLADNGYDVWLGNSRGNRYSSKHLKFNSTDFKSKFWDFSFHEIAVYDLPVVIDYVLRITERDQLSYVGHSQGTTDFFAMASEKPEFNSRIRLMIALSPILKMKNVQHRGLKWAAANIMTIRAVVNSLGLQGILFPERLVNNFVDLICKNQTFVPICKLFLLQNDYNYDTFMKNSQLPPEDVIKLLLEGVSGKQLYHLAQLIDTEIRERRKKNLQSLNLKPTNLLLERLLSLAIGDESVLGNFRQFNYGEAENLKHYHRKNPPEYDVRKITAPVALFYAYSDVFSCVKDIAEDKKILPNVVYEQSIDIRDFNHLDFIIRKNVTKILYKDILKLLNKYSSNPYIY